MAFKLKIVESWFSKKYVEFKYTKNGIFWKKIYCCKPPSLYHIDYDYTWEPLFYKLGNGNFDCEKENFSTYEKIKEFEKQEWEKYIKGNESLKEKRTEIYRKQMDALKRANK